MVNVIPGTRPQKQRIAKMFEDIFKDLHNILQKWQIYKLVVLHSLHHELVNLLVLKVH